MGERLQKVTDWKNKRLMPRAVSEVPNTGLSLTVEVVDGRVGPYLLGIDFGHIQSKSSVYDGKRKTQYEVQANTGIAGVVPAWKITDLLMTPKFVEDRATEDAELTRKQLAKVIKK
jgi:hypothetical protein